METLSYILDFLQTIAVVAAAVVAFVGIRSWRRELLGRRRSEIAEQAIVVASSVKDAFNYVRSPAGYKGEGQSRNREEDEKERMSERLDQDFVPIERLNKFTDEFAQLRSTMLLCKAHFEEGVTEPFDELFRIRSEIIRAARFRMMISSSNRLHNEKREEQYFQREEIIWDHGDEDKLNPRIEKAVSNIETYFGELLKP
ncbi:MAG: hypothetical protein F4160_10450 [Rhodospirillaceae bacterium]|nr:hypothetical protein [Rhodospirillaceae bacterium]MYH37207.1 hypothetical protein [Rhodospirillaceae bacterium]